MRCLLRISAFVGAAVILAAVVLFAVPRTTICTVPTRHDRTISDACTIAGATEMYMSENPRCPTISDLIAAQVISKRKVEDPWNHQLIRKRTSVGRTD
jgi:hypothetical protein